MLNGLAMLSVRLPGCTAVETELQGLSLQAPQKCFKSIVAPPTLSPTKILPCDLIEKGSQKGKGGDLDQLGTVEAQSRSSFPKANFSLQFTKKKTRFPLSQSCFLP